MSNTVNKIEALKRDWGFKLVRADRHKIWRSRDGIVFVEPSTPSDSYHGLANSLASLKRAIATAQRSEILAISDFERRLADEKIKGRQKQVASAAGAAGSTRKSKGTGFWYVDRDQNLNQLSPVERDAYLKAREDAAAKARANAAARFHNKMAAREAAAKRRKWEDLVERSFTAHSDAYIDLNEYDKLSKFEGAAHYTDATARAVLRHFTDGKPLKRLRKKPEDEDYRPVDCAIRTANALVSYIPGFIEHVNTISKSYSDEQEWAEEKERAGRDLPPLPLDAAMNLTLKSWMEHPEWEFESHLRFKFQCHLHERAEIAQKQYASLKTYLRRNALTFSDLKPEDVESRFAADKEKVQLLKIFKTEKVIEMIADWQKTWPDMWKEHRAELALAKEPKTEALAQRLYQGTQIERLRGPLVGLRNVVADVRWKISVMNLMLDELNSVIGKL